MPRPSHPSESLDPGQNGPAGAQRPENPPIAHRGRWADSALPPPLGKSCPRLPHPSPAPSPRTHHRTLTRSVATSPTHPDCRKPLILIVALQPAPSTRCPECPRRALAPCPRPSDRVALSLPRLTRSGSACSHPSIQVALKCHPPHVRTAPTIAPHTHDLPLLPRNRRTLTLDPFTNKERFHPASLPTSLPSPRCSTCPESVFDFAGIRSEVLAKRECTLQQAWSEHPERLVQEIPKPQPLPTEVWINPPAAASTPQPAH